MKHVFTHDQLAHVWAQQNQEEGRTSNKSMFFSGRTIYSYGHHFPIATFHPTENIVFYNSQSYSNTTGKHQRKVMGAINRDTLTVYVPDRKLMRNLVDWLVYSKEETKAYLLTQFQTFYNNRLESLKASLVKRRTPNTKWADVREMAYELNHYEQFLDAMGSNIGFYPLMTSREELTGVCDNLKGEVEAFQLKEKEKVSKALDLFYPAHEDYILNYWLHGISRDDKGREEYTRLKAACKGEDRPDTFLRYKADKQEIETTRGASFPLSHALPVFNNILLLKRFGRTYTRQEGHAPQRLGHFTVDSVDAEGNVKAGCHYVKWNAIELCARQLISAGLLPADCLDLLQARNVA